MERKIFKALLALMIIYLIFGQLFLPRESEPTVDYAAPLNVTWQWVKADGSRLQVDVPGSYDVPKGEVMTVETILPDDMEQNTFLRFYSLRQDIKVYVDGELRKSYSTKDTRLVGLTSSAYYLLVEMYPEDAGKTMTVEYMTEASYSGELRTVYYGDKMGIWSITFKENGVEIFIAIFTLVLGIFSVLASYIIRFKYKKTVYMEYLGWSVTLSSFWIITNSMFRQLIFPNLSTVSDATFYVVMLLPLPFMIYFNGIQNGRYKKWYYAIESAVIAILIINTGMHIVGYMDFSASLVGSAVVCMCAITMICITIMIDIGNKQVKTYFYSAVGMFGAMVAVVLQFALYYMKTDVPFSGAILSIGLTFLLVVSCYNTVRDMMRLEEEKQRAISSNESKARFLANMSHEIRTPINAILGMDEMILRESKQEKVTEYAKDIRSASKSLLSLINDILDFSKMESGRLDLIHVEYGLSSLLNDCYNLIAMRAEDKGLFFSVENDSELPSKLKGDEPRIRQIIINMLTNAVKYTKEGSVKLMVSSDGYVEDTLMLVISVSDTGMGIAPENQKRVFDVFQRVDEVRNRNVEGTGLGLSVTKQLVELMGGTLEVTSEIDKGSTFTVRLPQQIISEKPMGEFRASVRHDNKGVDFKHSFYAPKARVLVVDDVVMNLKVFTALLKGTGLTIDTAESGERCLQLVRKNQYDIIFLDHMMPEMDGVETLQKMKELMEYIDTPVIMLTANAMSGAKEDYLADGFHDYMSKPIQGKKLEEMIIKYLPEHKME